MSQASFQIVKYFCTIILSILVGAGQITPRITEKTKNTDNPKFEKTNSLADSILKNGYEVEKSLPNGYVKDGSVDYTAFVQAAVAKNEMLIFPGFPIQVNDKGILIGSNKKLLFLKGSVIVLKPSSKANYNILNIYQASNVTLIDPVIMGDRSQHTGNGVWGMGLGIYSSKNVTVSNPQISDCWGDGIYIARADNDVPCSKITISNCNCKNNRRNAVTVISVDGLNLISPYCSNSNEALPMDGIDIEPNDENDVVDHIAISNPKTEGNKGEGIQISLSSLQGSAPKQVNIKIDNHVDNSSNIAMLVSCFKKNNSTSNIKGSISVTNPVWVNNTEVALRATWLREPNVKLSVNMPSIISTNKALLSTDQLRGLLSKAVDKSTSYILSFD